MGDAMTINRVKGNLVVGKGTAEQVDTQVYTVGLVTVGVFAVVVGLWSLASLVGGLLASGGPGGLVKGWLTAVFGV
jgi:hypothetical protein